ncbi:hypothetical protein Tcan_17743 [Toxocara canis]|uniref:Uncharacterized protein n=1 Tax=Toxocara canis TaxID=6265 RepID=A0A0B2VU06_TOXCA|nr:hypothetical protein Tcan_17743 [Toxocara canis]
MVFRVRCCRISEMEKPSDCLRSLSLSVWITSQSNLSCFQNYSHHKLGSRVCESRLGRQPYALMDELDQLDLKFFSRTVYHNQPNHFVIHQEAKSGRFDCL